MICKIWNVKSEISNVKTQKWNLKTEIWKVKNEKWKMKNVYVCNFINNNLIKIIWKKIWISISRRVDCGYNSVIYRYKYICKSWILRISSHGKHIKRNLSKCKKNRFRECILCPTCSGMLLEPSSRLLEYFFFSNSCFLGEIFFIFEELQLKHWNLFLKTYNGKIIISSANIDSAKPNSLKQNSPKPNSPMPNSVKLNFAKQNSVNTNSAKQNTAK